ncbi:MAG TPA: enolase C-terminal domain-like protein [Candidatus Dormibacteraeota bacterium]|nr:enolase C-terminal domain-like protein [Candidatus Dormibacteraeota bacterium]
MSVVPDQHTVAPSPGSAVAPRVTVRRVEILPMKVRLNFRRTLSKGVVAGDNERPWVGDPVLIRIESTDGVSGFAQVRPPTPWLGETTDSVVAALRHYFGPALIGSDALERELIGPRLDHLLPGNLVALTGVDIALHDLVGRTFGLPIYSLLGGARTPIPMDWSISLNPPENMLEEAVRAVTEFGCRILCLKMGPSARWEEDIATFKRIRAEVGDHVEIGIDPNEGYDLATTLRVLRALDAEHVAYVEQPLHRDDHVGLRLLRAQGLAPLLIDESAIHVSDVQRLIAAGCCDGLVLKLWKSAGFAGVRRMATLAEASGLGTTLGGVAHGSLLEAAACAHLYSSLASPPLAAEFVLGLNVVDVDPIASAPEGFSVSDGSVRAPSGPGLGVEVDLDAARKLALASFVVDAA